EDGLRLVVGGAEETGDRDLQAPGQCIHRREARRGVSILDLREHLPDDAEPGDQLREDQAESGEQLHRTHAASVPDNAAMRWHSLCPVSVLSDSTLPRFQMSPDSAEGIPVMPPWSSVETHGGRGHHTLSRPGPPPGSIRRTRHRLDAVRSVVHDENTICHLPVARRTLQWRRISPLKGPR